MFQVQTGPVTLRQYNYRRSIEPTGKSRTAFVVSLATQYVIYSSRKARIPLFIQLCVS